LGTEPGITNPDTGSHVILRADGGVELDSGSSTRMILDDTTGGASITTPSLLLESNSQFLLYKKLSFNYNEFDPDNWWVTPVNLVDEVTQTISKDWKWKKAPIFATKEIKWGRGTTPFVDMVAGVPKEGQRNIDLGSWFDSRPLFGPQEILDLLKENLMSIVKSLHEMLPR